MSKSSESRSEEIDIMEEARKSMKKLVVNMISMQDEEMDETQQEEIVNELSGTIFPHPYNEETYLPHLSLQTRDLEQDELQRERKIPVKHARFCNNPEQSALPGEEATSPKLGPQAWSVRATCNDSIESLDLMEYEIQDDDLSRLKDFYEESEDLLRYDDGTLDADYDPHLLYTVMENTFPLFEAEEEDENMEVDELCTIGEMEKRTEQVYNIIVRNYHDIEMQENRLLTAQENDYQLKLLRAIVE